MRRRPQPPHRTLGCTRQEGLEPVGLRSPGQRWPHAIPGPQGLARAACPQGRAPIFIIGVILQMWFHYHKNTRTGWRDQTPWPFSSLDLSRLSVSSLQTCPPRANGPGTVSRRNPGASSSSPSPAAAPPTLHRVHPASAGSRRWAPGSGVPPGAHGSLVGS